MYKMIIDGVEVVASNANDVKGLIEAFKPAKKEVVAFKAPVGRPAGVKNSVRRRIAKYSHWTVEQVSYIWTHREIGARAMGNVAFLKEFHTPKAIGMMYYKVVNGPTGRNNFHVSPIIQEAINSFHGVTTTS